MNFEKISIFLLFALILYLFHKNNKYEQMNETGNLNNLDISAIKTLSDISQKLISGGLTIPGDVNIGGKLDVSTLTSNLLPKGIVVAWSGDPANIPKGWALCDGKDGRPDLIGKMILGSDQSKPEQKSGAKGGSFTAKLEQKNIPPHTHNISQAPNHNHSSRFGGGRANKGAREGSCSTEGWVCGNNGEFTLKTSGAGAHSHTMDNCGECKAEPFNVTNPYYALAYIIKI